MNDLPENLKVYLNEYRKERGFNPELKSIEISKKLSDYMNKCGLSGCVISVSGGVDSAVTYKLAKFAQELYPDIIKKVVPISQPIHSSDWALNRAQEVCKTCNEEPVVIDGTSLFDQTMTIVEKASGLKSTSFVGGQMKSYMRTPINYVMAQLLTANGTPSIVLGTGNMDEDGFLKYYCKPGDGTVDVQFIHDCHKSEVFQLAKYLGVPNSIVNAKPSADLWEGQSDEDELGVSYDFIELYTGYFLPMNNVQQTEFMESLSQNDLNWFNEKAKLCNDVHNRNSHKKSCAIDL